MKRFWPVLMALLVVAGLFFLTNRGAGGTQLGDYGPAPDFSLEDLDGRTVRLSEIEAEVIVVNLWATNCPPCRKEIPGFIRVYEELKDEGVMVLGVALDEGGKSAVAPFARDYSISYPVLIDPTRIAPRAFKLGRSFGIPITYLIDRRSRIRVKAQGYLPHDALERVVRQLLTESDTAPAVQ